MTNHNTLYSGSETLEDLLQHSRFAECIDAGKKLLVINGENGAVLRAIGIAHLQLEIFDEAEKFLRKAVSLMPSCSRTKFAIGLALKGLGLFDEALVYLLQILKSKSIPSHAYIEAIETASLAQKPNLARRLSNKVQKKIARDPSLLNRLALYELGVKNTDTAIRLLQSTISLCPKSEIYRNNLGNALRQKGLFDDAFSNYAYAKRINPKYAPAYVNSGATLQITNDYWGAIEEFTKALELEPKQPFVLKALADALLCVQESAAAIACLTNAIDMAPDSAVLHKSLGVAFMKVGNKAKAKSSLLRAAEINPACVDTQFTLSKLSLGKNDDTKLSQHLKNMINCEQFTKLDTSKLNFALGEIYERNQKYSEAFRCFNLGNKIRRATFEYNKSSTERTFDKLRKNFDRSDIKPTNQNPLNTIPIFILGMPRSGTTLVEQIVSAHSLVYGCEELNFIREGVEKTQLLRSGLKPDLLNELRQYYLNKIEKFRLSERYISDKMPLNFRWIGYIKLALPEAKIIEVTRNPAATCFSIFKSHFASSGNEYAYNLEEITHYYQEYDRLMKFWHQQFPREIIKISYDELVNEPQKQTKLLLKRLGFELEENCFDIQSNKRPVNTLSVMQVREKIYKDSSELWKKYQGHVDDMMESLKQLGL